jgi:hypothetical protein
MEKSENKDIASVEKAEENLKKMQSALSRLRVRYSKLGRLRTKLEEKGNTSDDENKAGLIKNILFTTKNPFYELHHVINTIDKEIGMLEKAVGRLQDAEDGETRDWFAQYVVENTSLSLHNVESDFERFDRCIYTLAEFDEKFLS